jgi:hypothetical protein
MRIAPTLFRSASRACYGLAATLFAVAIGGLSSPRADELSQSGVAVVPADAAFFSASLRLQEQFEAIRGSNAMKAILATPAVKQALDSLEEQQSMPGSPISMAATLLELPENAQAIEVVRDMISKDTFLYGEPSCTAFVSLLMKLQRANQFSGLIEAARGAGNGIEFDAVELIDEDGAPIELDLDFSSDELAGRVFFDTIAANVEMLVVPDLVWGFTITDRDSAAQQLKRIEVLLKLLTQAAPDFAESLERRKIAGGEFVTFALAGDMVPWGEIDFDELSDDANAIDRVVDRLESLELVVALGTIGSRVILSVGGSTDHLERLAEGDSGEKLLAADAFAPLRKAGELRLTGISYVSEKLARSLAGSADDIRQLARLAAPLAERFGLPEEAGKKAAGDIEKLADDFERLAPIPGDWMAFSYIGKQGYEGEVWDWTGNVALDGSKRLDILAHVGGKPLAAAAARSTVKPETYEMVVGWGRMVDEFVETYVTDRLDDDEREDYEQARERFGPLLVDLVTTVREKFLPALGDGQLALVLDDETRVERLQKELPAASEPLPVIEPAIVLGVEDAGLFKEGLNDLFALGDRLVNEVREADPDAIPADYKIPAPQKREAASGSIWSFAIPDAGLDERIAPAIGLGKEVAVFTLVPGQAERILSDTPLEICRELSRFDAKLAAAAALDVPAIIDLLEPWAIYAARYAAVTMRDGSVDPDFELTEDDETEEIRKNLAQAKVFLDVCRCLRAAVAEQSEESGAMVTRWRNVIEDLPPQ